MAILKKPNHLKVGDTVALISPSSGLAGEKSMIYRTKIGIKRLEDIFGLKVKIMPNALLGINELYENPKKRADDIHQALLDKEVKAIISFIGGKEALRVTKHLDIEILKNNPKIFMGYSDSTAIHMKFYQAGIVSFYGPAILTDFAENNGMDDYTINSIKKVLFSNSEIGYVKPSTYLRKFGLTWEEKNMKTSRKKITNGNYEIINGVGSVQGELIGGCMESLNNLRGTDLFPNIEQFKNKILFLENSEDQLPNWLLEQSIRTLGYMGILKNVSGIIIGKPQNGRNYLEIKKTWKLVLKEWKEENKPVFFNASFGHNEPKCIIPYGIKAELNTEKKSFYILENACK
ncbi:S66 family peptidase [Staphylococcus epidermidis]|uniref:S66 family peptidase n=1 Tax=Staphylococcus epidermidis TaxID=1282 RepID=UPI00029953B9|nr:S66 peptidase family protein [Staphylococcus epidermidis]EKS26387.1 hypothetical protein HMPREF9281_02333 [Staphylococcus epidermidis BVS058A4]